MISKKLLKEVLGYIIKEIKFDAYSNKIIFLKEISFESYGIKQVSNAKIFINIYELAHKCKEWAWKQGYNILIDCYNKNLTEFEIFVTKDYILGDNNCILYNTIVNNELEAMFKACNWILEKENINEL